MTIREINLQTGEVTERELTSDEFAAIAAIPPVSPVFVPLTPRQIRMALSRAGLRATVEAAVAAGDQDLKDWWEWSQTFERNHPAVVSMISGIGKTPEDADAIWTLGATL